MFSKVACRRYLEFDVFHILEIDDLLKKSIEGMNEKIREEKSGVTFRIMMGVFTL